MFREEVYPLVPDAEKLAETFKQKPASIPLELPIQPTYIIKQEINWIPIVAMLLGFFGLLAFLAFLRR